MAEVGILNLQIHDNSGKAAEGLGRLASALERVKSSVNGIKGLGSVATQIEKITRAVTNASTSGTVENLNGIASALKRVKEASQGIDLSNLKFSPRSGKLDIEAAIDRIKRATSEVNDGFVNVEAHVDSSRESASGFADQMERVNELVQNTAWSAGEMETAFSRAFKVWSDMRSSHSLGGTAPILGLGAGTSETGWTQYNPFGETGENGWKVWKDGAIEAEYTISDAMENIGNRIEDTKGLFLEAGESIKETGEEIGDALNESIKRVGNRDYGNGNYKQFNPASGFFESMQGIKSQKDLNDYRESLEGTKRTTEETIAELRQLFSESSDAIKGIVANNRGLTVDEIFPPEVPEILQDTGSSMTETATKSESLRDRLNELAVSAKNAVSNGLNNMREGMNNMMEPLSNLISRFGRIAMLRAMRYVIKEFTAAIKEGTQNMYQYSKAIGGEFASSMDSAASSLLMMKNSVGAALAPALQSIIPILNQIISVVITAINYLNQFLALLRGQSSWTRATPAAASAFNDIKKSAGGAAAAVKDLLADWDELNIIQSETGGGGGGGGGTAAEDYLSMFEEVSKFEKGLQSFVNHLKEEFGSIWGLAARIGAAVLGWKVSSAFKGLLGTLGGLVSAGAIIDLTFRLAQVFDKTYVDTGEIGWLVGDVLTTVIGATLANKVLSKVLNAEAAKLVIPLTLFFSAAASIKANVESTDVSALDEESIVLDILAGLKGGAATGYLYYLGGVGAAEALGAGAGASLLWFGVSLGIKTIAETVDTGRVTLDTIKADVAAALATGLGLGAMELFLGGTAATAGALAGGATALTFVALVGIEYLIASRPKRVEWGDFNATEEEIEAFVENSVFRVSSATILKLINPKIDAVSESGKALEATTEEVLLTAGKITIGYNSDEVLKELEKQIFGDSENGTDGLIGQFKQTAKDKQNVIETGLMIEFTDWGNGNGETGTFDKEAKEKLLGATTSGWEAITEHMEDLGRQLSTAMKKAYNAEIGSDARAMEVKTITELTQMMARVSAAITKGSELSQIQRSLSENLDSLTAGSFDKLFDYINEYKEQIVLAEATAYDAVTDNMAGELSGLQATIENELELAKRSATEAERKSHEATAKAYQDEYDSLKEIYDARVAGRKAALEKIAESTENDEVMKLVRDAILGKLQGQVGAEDILGANADIMDMIRSAVESGTTDTVIGAFDAALTSYFGKDAETLKKAIDAGILNYTDLISMEAIAALKKQAGINTPELEAAWNEMLKNIFGSEVEMPVEAETIEVDQPVEVQTEMKEAVDGAMPDATDVVGNLAENVSTELGETQDAIAQATMPPVNEADTSALLNGLANTATATWGYVTSIINAIEWLNGIGINTHINVQESGGGGSHGFATGGIVRTADMFMANENGNIEMMGKMGHSTVVANNQQIVEGISRGVSQSNSGMENSMNIMVSLMRQFVNKEFTAKVVPSASMGRSNKQSERAYDKVTG